MPDQALEFRYEVRPEDREAVRRLVASTGVFSPVELDVAVELVDSGSSAARRAVTISCSPNRTGGRSVTRVTVRSR